MTGYSRALLGAVLVAFLPSPSAAQAVARTFSELQTILSPKDYVIVVDRADREVWGPVVSVTDRTITVASARRAEGRVEIAGERREFTEESVRFVLRSDRTGARGAGVYPASWNRVEAMPHGSDVTIVLTSGERQQSRIAEVTADELRVLTPSGQSARFAKSDVLRIERRGVDDPVGNGIAIGALAGAGAGFAIVSVMYATCGDGCEAPAEGPTYFASLGFGAGIGAAIGWVADRTHKGKEVVFPTVAPIVTRERKGLTLTLRF
jgi:hypothetical protein